MRDRIRSFVAVELDLAARGALAATVHALADRGADVKWVATDALHVTLKFLGEVARTDLPDVLKVLGAAVTGALSFSLEIFGVSFFPSPVTPRVVAAGIAEPGASSLARLAGRIDEATGTLGFPREHRAFKPHITLGRVKSPRGMHALSDALLTADGELLTRQDVAEVVLFMSELSRAGPTYTALGRFPLTCGADEAP